MEGVSRAQRVDGVDRRHRDRSGASALPPLDGPAAVRDRDPRDADGPQARSHRFGTRIRVRAQPEVPRRRDDVAARDELGEVRLPPARVENHRHARGPRRPGRDGLERGVVPVEKHDVPSSDELVDVAGRRDLDPAAVGRDDGPLPRPFVHRDRGDRQREPAWRDVDHPYPVRLQVVPGRRRGGARAERGHERGAPAERREHDRGVGGRTAGRDVLPPCGDLGVRVRWRADAVDDVERRQPDEQPRRGGWDGHGPSVRGRRPWASPHPVTARRTRCPRGRASRSSTRRSSRRGRTPGPATHRGPRASWRAHARRRAPRRRPRRRCARR